MEPLIYEISSPGRCGANLPACDVPERPVEDLLGAENLRDELPLPEVSELDVVRHFVRLSQRNYGIEVGFYPLGSCTMKYNPRVHEKIASIPNFTQLHPLQPESTVQGALQLLWEMQQYLGEIAGMDAVTLQPAAGAHGEILSLMIFKAYHASRGEAEQRKVVLVPDTAHGTNPASAASCGFTVRTLPSDERGCIDLRALREAVGPDTVGLMLTNPNTLGLFETQVREVCDAVHEAGGLVYCDGANMNALLGIARPGDMGFDAVHFNLHKTFSTPHGGGGPGAGAIAVKAFLEPFLPVPVVVRRTDGSFGLEYDRPQSIGRIHSFTGNFLNVVRAYAYIRTLGPDGLRAVAEHAVLNANYLRVKLQDIFPAAYDRMCMHECVLTAQRYKTEYGVRAFDIAKRLIDYGFHPPTVYFPLIVPEALMIEPTETESVETLDAFVNALHRIAEEARENPELLHEAPHHTPVRRLDEAKAAKELCVCWQPGD